MTAGIITAIRGRAGNKLTNREDHATKKSPTGESNASIDFRNGCGSCRDGRLARNGVVRRLFFVFALRLQQLRDGLCRAGPTYSYGYGYGAAAPAAAAGPPSVSPIPSSSTITSTRARPTPVRAAGPRMPTYSEGGSYRVQPILSPAIALPSARLRLWLSSVPPVSRRLSLRLRAAPLRPPSRRAASLRPSRPAPLFLIAARSN